MKHRTLIATVVLFAVFALLQACFAEVSAEEAAKLKTTLTPFGGERAGNKEGTIPAWDGGITQAPAGYTSGDRRPNPFPGEKPLFSIDGKNMSKYEDKLAEATKFMLKKYPGFRLDVYPTHRTGAAPQWIYDNIFKNATRAKTTNNGLTVTGAYGGIPFPIPKDGNEAIFNHLLAYRGTQYQMPFTNYVVTPEGKAVLASRAVDTVRQPYFLESGSLESFKGYYLQLRQIQTAPPFKNGESILTWDPVDQYGVGRSAWQYLTGQRRVRRAPSIGFDTPDFVSSGQDYFDEVYMYNGSIERYDWKLLGKKEMYIPYNCYEYYLAPKDSDVIGVGMQYLNPDKVRWELHRVWVVEATLAPGKRHVVAKRRFYLDEDSWYVILYDGWDGQGKLWRHTQGVPINLYELPATVPIAFCVHNLQTGGRDVNNQVTESNAQMVSEPYKPDSYYSPDDLASTGVR